MCLATSVYVAPLWDFLRFVDNRAAEADFTIDIGRRCNLAEAVSVSGPSIGGRDLNALSRINKEGSGAAEVTMVLDFALFFASVTLVACAIISWLALLCRHTRPQPQHIMKKRLPVSNLK